MSEDKPEDGPSRIRVVVAFVAVYLLWGSTYLAIRFAVQSMPPLLMAGTRHLVSGLVMLGVARARGVALPTRRQWRDASIVGLLLLLGSNGTVTWAEQWVPSALAALLLASVPLWMGLIGGILEPQSRPRTRGIAGIIVGFAGVAILVEPRGELASSTRVFVGALSILGASICWASGSLFARHARVPKDPILTVALQMLAGAAGLLVVGSAAGEWHRVHVDAITARSALSLLYLIVFGSIVGFSAYSWLLRVAAPAKVATYAYVNPMVAVLLGATLGNEPVGVRTLVAAAAIVGAVVLITSERKMAPTRVAVPEREPLTSSEA
ncbi:MAG: EamA family transporter [bacterium]